LIKKASLIRFALAVSVLGAISGCGQNTTQNNAAGTTGNTSSNGAIQSTGGSTGNHTTSVRTAQTTNLSVLYAGSMTKVMEQKIGPQADSALGIHFQGEGKGSTALAQMMRSGLRTPDVFISAAPSANNLLMGASNHNLVKWYLALAQDQLVIAYSPKSKFAGQLQQAAKGALPWYKVMEEPGFRFGRTDPLLDPKGESTIFMFKLAETYYHQPDLFSQILKSNENPSQVFPEESLLSQLTTGQVDAIIAYKHEAVEWNVPYITLPDAINLGNANDAAAYAKATITEKNGKVKHGAPILFTITVPTNAPHPSAGTAFARYLISGPGHEILMKDGFTSIGAYLGGSKAAVPSSLQNLIQGQLK
jgi:molybdate/tungstate transport system substrate-binding protein